MGCFHNSGTVKMKGGLSNVFGKQSVPHTLEVSCSYWPNTLLIEPLKGSFQAVISLSLLSTDTKGGLIYAWVFSGSFYDNECSRHEFK